ncbi:MAG: hypothetical protein JXB48_05535 [Candidatus Latescibacteria bacterium]|nr:hypothetical protein [Candidatus Latescibacterota bacterium]
MKKKGFFFVCDNCGYEFYSKKSTGSRRFIQCLNCGELTACMEDEPDESDIVYDIDNDDVDIYDEYNDLEDEDNIEYQGYDN